MSIIISGYGTKPQNTIARYQLKDNNFQIEWQASVDNASFVCEGNSYLFTVTEADDYAVIYAYRMLEQGYLLIDQKRLEGGALCHISYSEKNKALFGACYLTGTIFSIEVQDGKFGELLHYEVQHQTPSDELTRAHCVVLNQEETELISANIALDVIYFYKIIDGKLQHSSVITMPQGVGPRHVILSGDQSYLYVITEYSNEIFVYSNNADKILLQRISTLTDDYTGNSNCSTLCFSKNGNYLYAANRGADTIAVFDVNKDGTLNRHSETGCGGKHPRHMMITKDGRYLIVCNQNSNQVTAFLLDTDQGNIQKKAAELDFMAPSGIVEV